VGYEESDQRRLEEAITLAIMGSEESKEPWVIDTLMKAAAEGYDQMVMAAIRKKQPDGYQASQISRGLQARDALVPLMSKNRIVLDRVTQAAIDGKSDLPTWEWEGVLDLFLHIKPGDTIPQCRQSIQKILKATREITGRYNKSIGMQLKAHEKSLPRR
jgi:hypothetical protein